VTSITFGGALSRFIDGARNIIDAACPRRRAGCPGRSPAAVVHAAELRSAHICLGGAMRVFRPVARVRPDCAASFQQEQQQLRPLDNEWGVRR